MDNCDLVAYYQHRYRYAYLLTWILATDRMALEAARDSYWYLCGKYEATGHDRAGVAYVQTADEWGDSRWSLGADVERGNEYSVMRREQR